MAGAERTPNKNQLLRVYDTPAAESRVVPIGMNNSGLFAFAENVVNFIVGQLFAAARGDIGGIGNGAEVRVGGNTQLGKGSGQFDFLDEAG